MNEMTSVTPPSETNSGNEIIQDQDQNSLDWRLSLQQPTDGVNKILTTITMPTVQQLPSFNHQRHNNIEH